ncbi:MAG: sigma 54-interacting transcriptional regulator [Polyangiaceae bacterium]|nr:sigma 54-interacting transcriptional regulator [Polyangiaceae bacterium]
MALRWVFPGSAGMLTPLTAPRLVLGRGESCDVRLPGTETSRQHAEIRREGAFALVRDLESRNGVFVDGKAVREAALAPGHVLRLGEWIGVVALMSAAALDRERVSGEPVFQQFAPGLVGGPALRSVLDPLRRAAASTLPIVIVGETGTGKEGCAQAAHRWSGRSGDFVAFNCATLAPTLADAELFGYRKGAFTGADRSHPGFFRAAHRGTLFLDELSELPEAVQAKLLRTLQQGEVLPLGEARTVPVDVRVVAATQVPPAQAIAEQRLRSDLAARLDGLTLDLPPLRARQEEIPYLFSYLLAQHSGAQPAAVEPRLLEQLCLYDWPFNVRELDLLVRRLLVLHAHEGVLRRSHLPARVLRCAEPKPRRDGPQASSAALPSCAPPANTPEAHRARRDREFDALMAGLRAHSGNVARAAAAAGISRQRAYRLMQANQGGGLAEASPGACDEP